MSPPAESKPALFALLFAWPAAALLGLGVGRVTHTGWPAAVFPFAWLVVLFVVLTRYTSRSR